MLNYKFVGVCGWSPNEDPWNLPGYPFCQEQTCDDYGRTFPQEVFANLGNPEGDVTVVEFFDYNCPYCRSAGQTLQALLAADANVRVIYREWPILGEDSVIAARAALAAREQGKYEAFHWALMNGEGRVTEAIIFKVARDLGMDVAKLEADMVSPAVEAHIALSNALAQQLGFTGTPAFIVGDKTAPGMLSFDEITRLVADARNTP